MAQSSVPSSVSNAFQQISDVLRRQPDVEKVQPIEAPNDNFIPGGYIPIDSANRWGFDTGYVVLFDLRITMELCKSNKYGEQKALESNLEQYLHQNGLGNTGVAVEQFASPSTGTQTLWPKIAIYYPTRHH